MVHLGNKINLIELFGYTSEVLILGVSFKVTRSQVDSQMVVIPQFLTSFWTETRWVVFSFFALRGGEILTFSSLALCFSFLWLRGIHVLISSRFLFQSSLIPNLFTLNDIFIIKSSLDIRRSVRIGIGYFKGSLWKWMLLNSVKGRRIAVESSSFFNVNSFFLSKLIF